MNPVVIACPLCEHRYRYDPDRFGRTGVRLRCRHCAAVMEVNLPEGTASSGENASSLDGAAPAARPIPVSTAPRVPTPIPVAAVAPAATKPGPRRALVADADAQRRRGLVEELERAGWEVQEARDGLEARTMVGEARPELVVLNAFLPELLGVSLCSHIKRHPDLSRLSVVLVGSQYRRDRFVRDPGTLYGANAFLDGSGPLPDIQAALRLLLEDPALAGSPAAAEVATPEDELRRLARIVAADIILYNGSDAERALAEGRFIEVFAAEIQEGAALVDERFPALEDRHRLYTETLHQALSQHARDAGLVRGVLSRG